MVSRTSGSEEQANRSRSLMRRETVNHRDHDRMEADPGCDQMRGLLCGAVVRQMRRTPS
jgi:hypothetical protein